MTLKQLESSDVLGENYYVYDLASSNYTPSLNGSIMISCTVKDVYGAVVASKSITLYQNGSSVSSKTTNSSGVASWTITCSSGGMQVFSVGNSKLALFVDNKSEVGHTHSQYLTEHQSLSNYVTTSDSRLSDARTPTSHAHGNISNAGAIGSTSGKIITTGTSGVLQASDSITKSQISDFPSSMTPTSHTHGGLTNDGKLGTTSGKPVITTSGGAITTGSFGSTSGTFAEGNHTHSQYLTEHQSLSNYVQKSNSEGLIKNDGTVDTTTYSTFSGSYNDLSNKPTIPSDQSIVDLIYPVGSIYMSINSTNPNAYFGGTWEQIAQGRTLIGQGTGTDSNSESKTFSYGTNGGEYNHTLTETEMPSHTHTQNAHNHSFDGTNKAVTVGSAQDWKLSPARKMSYTSGSYYYPYSESNADGVGEVSTTENATATNQASGSGNAHNNLPPYFVTYIFKRTA